MPAQVGSLRVTLGANTAQFEQGMRRAAAQSRTFSSSIQRNLSGLGNIRGLALTAGTALAGLFTVAGLRRGLDYAASLGEVASQLGVTARELQIYRAIAGQVGVEQQALETGLAKLTLSIGQAANGVSAQASAFRGLGIAVRDAAGNIRPTEQILLDLADAMGRLPNPQARFAALFPILGRSTRSFINVLNEGRQSLVDYARQMEASGQILSDSEINRADQIADRVEALNRQMSVSWARVVSSNAGAIMGLASAFHRLSGEVVQFLSQNQRLVGAGLGGLIGFRLGGPVGAGVGAGVGYEMGNAAAHASDDANMEPTFRVQQLNNAVQELRARVESENTGGIFRVRTRHSDRSGTSVQEATAEVNRQRALLAQSMAARGAAPARPGGEAPAFQADPTSGGGGGPHGRTGAGSATNEHEQAVRRAYDTATELRRAQMDEMRAQLGIVQDTEARAALSTSILDMEQSQDEADRRLSVALGTRTDEEAKQLGLVQDHTRLLEYRAAQMEEQERTRAGEQEVAGASLDLQRDVLETLGGLDDTTASRRRTALALLRLEEQQERLAIEGVLASKDSTEYQRRIAMARRDALSGIYSAREQAIGRQYGGPLADYLNTLPVTAERVRESLQSVAVEGLGSIQEALVGIISGTENVGDAFKKMAASIIADLIRIQVQRAIIGPLANALGGLFAGVGASSFGSNAGMQSLLFGGARAAGGPTLPGRTYLIGEKGPELLHMGGVGHVVPNHEIGGAGGGRIIVELRDEMLSARIAEGSNIQIAQAYPAIKHGVMSSVAQQARRRG